MIGCLDCVSPTDMVRLLIVFSLVSLLDAYNFPWGPGRTGRTYTSGVGWHGTDGLVAFLDHDRVGTG